MSVEQIDLTRPRVCKDGFHTIGEGGLEVSVIMPCLDEHETVGVCVQK